MPAKAAKKTSTPSFYQKVNQDFYAEVASENGGKLPADLLDARGNPRKLTMSAADRGYRQKWNAIAANARNSRAVADKGVGSACVPCAAKPPSKIPPVVLPSKTIGKPIYVGSVQPQHTVTAPTPSPSAADAFGLEAAAAAAGAAIAQAAKALFNKFPHTENYSKGVDIHGSADFRKKTRESLDRLMATATGKNILDDMAASGKKVEITETTDNNGYCKPKDAVSAVMSNGKTGAGSDSIVQFNPNFTPGGIPNEDVFGHELIHAQHNARGIHATGATDGVNNEELQTVGLPPYKEDGMTENSLRTDLKLPRRTSY
jgi:hypothetical protein